jgi:hypothetical protein
MHRTYVAGKTMVEKKSVRRFVTPPVRRLYRLIGLLEIIRGFANHSVLTVDAGSGRA